MLLIAAPFTVVLLAAVYWRARQAPAPVLTLGAIPAALLLLALPVPFLLFGITRAFQGIAERGSGGVTAVSEVLVATDTTLWRASWAAMAVVTAALLVQWLRSREGPHSLADTPEEESPPLGWREWIVVAAPLVVVFVAALTLYITAIPALVAGPGLDVVINPAGSDSGTLGTLSQSIASRLVAGTLGGLAVAALAGLAALAVVVVAPGARGARRLSAYSAVMAILVIAGSGANAARLGSEVSWIRERARVAATVERERQAQPTADVNTAVGDAVPAEPSPPAIVEPNAPGLTIRSLRTDGVYRSADKIGDNFHFWVFKANGTCIAAGAPFETLTFDPPPLPGGMRWECRDVDGHVEFAFVSGTASDIVRGTIVSREHLRLDGVDYRFQRR